jgi:hypothetical protein
LIGCDDGRAAAGWRLHDDTARKMSTARRTLPSAPTPAFVVIDSRTPSREATWIAREYIHEPSAFV